MPVIRAKRYAAAMPLVSPFVVAGESEHLGHPPQPAGASRCPAAR